MLHNKKVLVIMGEGKLLGQQRANIQVFHTLRSEGITPLFILGLREETDEIVNHLAKLDFKFERILFAELFNKGMGFIKALKNILCLVKSNFYLLRQLIKLKPGYIHITNEINFRNFFPVLFLAFKPIIYRIGDTPRQHHWIFRFIWKILIIPLTKKFICVSEYVKRILIQAGANEKNIRVVYSFPPVRSDKLFKSNNTLERVKDDYNLVFIGQITNEKGIHLLIEACIELFNQHKKVNLLIAGSFNPEFGLHEELIEKVKMFDLEDRILFLGTVENIEEVFSVSKLHICPSIWEEPLSNTVMEAKSYSLPSVIFKSGGLPEVINHKIDGYICSNKTSISLAEGIVYFIKDSERTNIAGKEANKSLERLGVTPEAFKKKWSEIYENK